MPEHPTTTRDWTRIVAWGFVIATVEAAGELLGDTLLPDSMLSRAAVPAASGGMAIVLMTMLTIRRYRRDGSPAQSLGPAVLLPIAVAFALGIVFDSVHLAALIGGVI